VGRQGTRDKNNKEEDVKKILMLLAGVVTLLAVSMPIGAMEMKEGVVMGKVIKADGEFVTIKTAEGETKTFHMDKTTKITGELKAGAHVSIEDAKGHAMSVSVEKQMAEHTGAEPPIAP